MVHEVAAIARNDLGEGDDGFGVALRGSEGLGQDAREYLGREGIESSGRLGGWT